MNITEAEKEQAMKIAQERRIGNHPIYPDYIGALGEVIFFRHSKIKCSWQNVVGKGDDYDFLLPTGEKIDVKSGTTNNFYVRTYSMRKDIQYIFFVYVSDTVANICGWLKKDDLKQFKIINRYGRDMYIVPFSSLRKIETFL